MVKIIHKNWCYFAYIIASF